MAVGRGIASRFDRAVMIERPVSAAGLTDAGKGTWAPVAEVSAEVVDMLPSRGERLADGINVASRPARVRIRYREGISAEMRFVMGARIMQIVSGPAEVGRREAMEFMTVEWSSAGNAA